MFRLFFLTSTVFSAATAWIVSSKVSSFGGSVLLTAREQPLYHGHGTGVCSTLEMKGSGGVPPHMRGQMKKQKEMAAYQKQMVESQQQGNDGFPIFNLFVRTSKANMWYPCGSFKGDERSAALAKSYADDGMLSGVSKKQLDGGIAGSLYSDKDKLVESITRTYPQLRKARDNLKFGYKLVYDGLSDAQTKQINEIEPKEQKGMMDNLKNIFSK